MGRRTRIAGLHTDYHKPSDDAHKINYQNLKTVVGYAKDVLDTLSQEPNLAFTKTKTVAKKEAAKFKITLGIFPDYKNYGDGLHIQEVIENRTAQKYGLQAGDIITKIGKQDITDIYSYMEALAQLQKSKKYLLIYLRANKETKVIIKF